MFRIKINNIFFAFTLANIEKMGELCTRKTKDGGCSSVWLERQIVALEVAGSIPVTHPIKWDSSLGLRVGAGFFCLPQLFLTKVLLRKFGRENRMGAKQTDAKQVGGSAMSRQARKCGNTTEAHRRTQAEWRLGQRLTAGKPRCGRRGAGGNRHPRNSD